MLTNLSHRQESRWNRSKPIFTLVTLLLLFVSVSAKADKTAFADGTSKVVGKVADAQTGEPIIGATILIEETSYGAYSDLDGNFQIRKVPFGYYTIRVSSVGYKTTKVSDVGVAADQNTVFNIVLEPKLTEVDSIVVTGKIENNTTAILQIRRKKANVIQDAVSAQEIARSGSSDAADAVKKVVGASVVDGKDVYVRGLGDRYANTQLNGSALASPDPDKQTTPLDLIPSGLLDNIVVEKSFTPDKAGNFAGGSVNLGTKDYPENRSLKVSTSVGFNSLSTFEDNLAANSSDDDWLAYDDGMREVPAYVQDNSEVLDGIGEGISFVFVRYDMPQDSINLLNNQVDVMSQSVNSFSDEMAPHIKSTPIDQSYSVSYGDSWTLFDRPLGIVASLSYSRKHTAYNNGFSGKYELRTVGNYEDIAALSDFAELEDSKATDEVLWGSLINVKYGIHPNHKLGFTHMYTRNGINEARYLEGSMHEHITPGEGDIRDRAISYNERKLKTYQFSGDHYGFFGSELRANWQASFSDTRQYEPDTRYFTDWAHLTLVEDEDSGDLYEVINYEINPSMFRRPTRLWRDITEDSKDFKLDLELPILDNGKFKTGTAYTKKDRSTREERYYYTKAGSGYGGDPNIYVNQTDVLIDSTAHVYYDTLATAFDTAYDYLYEFSNYLSHVVVDKNQYDGEQKITALYAMFELPLTSRFNFIGGARYEKTEMFVKSHDDDIEPGSIDDSDILPSINLVYRFNSNMNLRASYGRTIARPTMREISPAATADFGVSRIFNGNPNLEQTLIDNYDLRWEWFMSPGEIFAISGFYKYFKDPIELTIKGANSDIVPTNVPRAEVYGFELEFRRNLGHAFEFLRNFNVGGNFIYVFSEVEVPEYELDQVDNIDEFDKTRPMFGQSPYVVNLDIGFNSYKTGTEMSMFYNIFGERLAFNSEGKLPDIYEQPRNQLDFISSQKIFENIKLKFSIKNILAEDVEFTHEDVGVQAQQDGQVFYERRYKTGTTFSLGVDYQIW